MTQYCDGHDRYEKSCRDCLLTSREYNRWIRRQHAYGRPPLVPADEARAHIEALIAAGTDRSAIARAAGVSPMTIHNLVHQQTARIRRPVHEAILATTATVPTRVSAVGSMRRLRHLHFMGWTGVRIHAHTGISKSILSAILQGHRATIHRTTAERIQEFYEAHWDVDGGSTRSKGAAERNGWVSALAWGDIDNPNERPKGVAA